jgi:peptide-methionine (S)-S-oxide reductase
VGYTGGIQPNPVYRNIQDATEALWIEFNPQKVSYWEILEHWHDNTDLYAPEQLRQYRTAIWWTSESQQQATVQFLERVRAKKPDRELYVDVEPATTFYQAEEYHQDYLAKKRKVAGANMFAIFE